MGDRVDVLAAILHARGGADCNSLVTVLLQIKALSHERNLVAHNSVGIDIFMRADRPDDYEMEESIRSEKNRDKFLSLPELVAHRKHAEHLARSVYFYYSLVRHGRA